MRSATALIRNNKDLARGGTSPRQWHAYGS